ncbi:hypothetical protein SAMN02746089_01906 [Caldanaerobius fijiensis DSM 17918]|uniref:Uncharacterized protein n=1 Tax=Caldanaerobius fijiensis DSM 17918 TaxID=1121256 RepID=A0A1M5BLL5_9THEO|nr:hypothetical protein [Caldanaerobius fijiensis]SHF43295.1 hypothetical protein SAMN02746089_01906 [Caldanaerobius fijiensis DSM 17918]
MMPQDTPSAELIETFLNPESAVFKKAKRAVEIEMNIAFEVFMAEQYSRIHYSDLMEDVPEELASKDRLVSWLNDYRRGKIVRPGLITLYKNNNPGHFQDGIWQARYFCLFVKYLKEMLTNQQYVRNKKIAENFALSFANSDWYWSAVGISSLKLLENLYKQNALQTSIAKAYIRQTLIARELLNSVGKIIGRSTKNHDAYEMKDILPQIVEKSFKQQLKCSFDIFANNKEYLIYRKYVREIYGTLQTIYLTPNASEKFLPEGKRGSPI